MNHHTSYRPPMHPTDSSSDMSSQDTSAKTSDTIGIASATSSSRAASTLVYYESYSSSEDDSRKRLLVRVDSHGSTSDESMDSSQYVTVGRTPTGDQNETSEPSEAANLGEVHPSLSNNPTSAGHNFLMLQHPTNPANNMPHIGADAGPPTVSNPELLNSHYYCYQCGEFFYWRSRFLFHRFRVHGHRLPGTDLLHFCRKCEAAFLEPKEKELHIARVHDKLRPYKCRATGCTRAFFTRREMTMHYNVRHLQLRPYSCEYCHKKFGRAEHRNSHVKHVHDASDE